MKSDPLRGSDRGHFKRSYKKLGYKMKSPSSRWLAVLEVRLHIFSSAPHQSFLSHVRLLFLVKTSQSVFSFFGIQVDVVHFTEIVTNILKRSEMELKKDYSLKFL